MKNDKEYQKTMARIALALVKIPMKEAAWVKPPSNYLAKRVVEVNCCRHNETLHEG